MKMLKIFIDKIQPKEEEVLYNAAIGALGRKRVRIHDQSLRTQIIVDIKKNLGLS